MNTDIAVLFARDPLSLTKDDIDSIITAVRGMRTTFNDAPVKPATQRAPAKPRGKMAKLTEGLDIDIDLS